MLNPDSVIKSIYSRMSKQSWIAAISTIISGYLAHIFILTNEFFNHDDLSAWMVSTEGYISPTRWFQSVFSGLVSPLGSGVMSGSLTILILAVSSLLLVDTLKIQSHTFSVIIGVMMVVSPIVASFMSYVNGSFLFVIGIPFSILAVRWFEKNWKWYIVSSIFLMCAIAGYQSNIAITISIMYILLLGRLLEKDVDVKKWWISFAKAFGILVLGLLLYLASNRLVATITGDGGLSGEGGYSVGISTGELTAKGYDGQAETGTLYVSEITNSIKTAVAYFIKYNFNTLFDGANISFASKLNVFSSIILFILLAVALLNVFIKQKGLIKKIMIALVVIMAPICINSTEIMLNGKCDETLQMMYSMIMVVPLIVVILEKNDEYTTSDNKVSVIISNSILNIAVVAFLFHAYGNMQIVNDAYQRMNSEYETAYGEMCRIIDRVEQLPEWQDGDRVLYFDYADYPGTYLINDNYQAFVPLYEPYIDMGWMGVFGTQVHNFWNNKNTSKFVECYFGLVFESPTEEQIERIKESEEYESLKQFPSKDAVKVINGVVVVRMDDKE